MLEKKPKSILDWRIYYGCYQNPVSSNPVFSIWNPGFLFVESGFLKSESEHEYTFWANTQFGLTTHLSNTFGYPPFVKNTLLLAANLLILHTFFDKYMLLQHAF